jgi:predicted membrane-bound dolichyl-phosphate-mannose-protein mannosyltransferase
MIAVIIFGAGYWAVSRDLLANRTVVWMGLIAKLLIFFTFVYYYILGQATWFSVFGCSGDFAFSILFILFLYQTKEGIY